MFLLIVMIKNIGLQYINNGYSTNWDPNAHNFYKYCYFFLILYDEKLYFILFINKYLGMVDNFLCKNLTTVEAKLRFYKKKN